MTSSHPPRPTRARPSTAAGLSACALGWLGLACASKPPAGLADLCLGAPATTTVEATIDTTRPPANPSLTTAKGQHFTMRFTFGGQASTAASGKPVCAGRSGTATFDADFPEAIRNAASATRQATWRIDDETLMLDLNPGTRDNNVFVTLPINGGEGHWGLSTFAGEVASGRTRTIR